MPLNASEKIALEWARKRRLMILSMLDVKTPGPIEASNLYIELNALKYLNEYLSNLEDRLD